INIAQPRFFHAADSLMTAVPLGDWRAYLRWHFASHLAPWLSSPFVDASFQFQRALIGVKEQQPRWKRWLQAANAMMGHACLQAPFFDPAADDAVNYGGMGAVIGHEMTHGFDDQGRQFDAEGNLRDWWTPDDAQRFKERAARVATQFDAYTVVDSATHVNGRLTLGENIADLGGLKV